MKIQNIKNKFLAKIKINAHENCAKHLTVFENADKITKTQVCSTKLVHLLGTTVGDSSENPRRFRDQR